MKSPEIRERAVRDCVPWNASLPEVLELGRKGKKGRVAAKRRRSSWPPGWSAIIAVILAFTLAAVLHVRARLVVVQIAYQLSEAAKENKRLMTAARKLRLEVATLRNPRRLRHLATEKLGLAEPDPAQILKTGTGRGKVAASAVSDTKEPL